MNKNHIQIVKIMMMMSNEYQLMTDNLIYQLDDDMEAWNDYDCNEFVQILKQRERKKYVFVHKSDQLAYRSILIGYMRDRTTQTNTKPSCLHAAIYLLDLLMDNHSILLDRLITVSEACLALAMKLEENVPMSCFDTSSTQNVHDNNNMERIKCEYIILKYFKWNVALPTVPHFLCCYMRYALTDEEIDYIINKEKKSRASIIKEFHLNINYCLNKIIDDFHYNYYQSSVLAAATIALARFNMNLPSWTMQLQILTGYSSSDLEGILLTFLGTLSLCCEVC